MHKIFYPPFFIILFALLLAGGFFIGQNNFASAGLVRQLIISMDDGSTTSSPDWFCDNCGLGGSNDFYYFKQADLGLISKEIIVPDCISAEFEFRARTYNKLASNTSTLHAIVSISQDLGSNFQLIDMADVLTSSLVSSTLIDLTSYCGKSIIIKITTPIVTGTTSTVRTIGIDNLLLAYSYAITNQPPVPFISLSTTTAETNEEIFFDGRDSIDDGEIVDWYWDFGNGHFAYASTTNYAYATRGIYEVSLGVTDDQGLSATSTPLNITISDIATTTPTSTPSVGDQNYLVLNEIYPSPATGEDEWVEIYNPTSSTIDLAGLYLLNIDGGKFVTTTISGTIEAESYVVINDITGSLNNSGDTVVLRSIYPAGGLGVLRSISETTYGDFSGKSDASWARGSDGSYSETINVTKGSSNIITARPTPVSRGTGGSVSDSVINKIETTTTNAIATSTLIDYYGKIIINEIYPNPSDDNDEEFIELLNISTSTIDLARFIVGDASKSIYRIKASSTATSTTLIKPGEYYVIKKSTSKLSLNNSGIEYVRLYAPDAVMIDEVEYLGENERGVSYSRTDDGKWHWVKTATSGETNADDELYSDQENAAILDDQAIKNLKITGIVKASSKSSKIVKAVNKITLAELANFGAGDLVQVRGVVAVLPGILGSQYFYIADGGQGAQVYSYKKDFPELQIGDQIEVIGELSDSSVGRRIKTTDHSQIKIIERLAPPAPRQITGLDVGEETEGSLVILTGEVLELQSRNIIIDDGSNEVKVYINSKMDLKDINAKPGDKMAVIGIVGKTSSGYRILPRDLKDIQVIKGEVKGDFSDVAKESKNGENWYFGAIIVFLCCLVGIMWWKLKR
ncbi:MAG: lamin tail domain-containing protein [Candidatus Buchananbacteria bacterium]|jgi:PKD repeat protein